MPRRVSSTRALHRVDRARELDRGQMADHREHADVLVPCARLSWRYFPRGPPGPSNALGMTLVSCCCAFSSRVILESSSAARSCACGFVVFDILLLSKRRRRESRLRDGSDPLGPPARTGGCRGRSLDRACPDALDDVLLASRRTQPPGRSRSSWRRAGFAAGVSRPREGRQSRWIGMSESLVKITRAIRYSFQAPNPWITATAASPWRKRQDHAREDPQSARAVQRCGLRDPSAGSRRSCA